VSGVFGGGAGYLIKEDPGVQADNGGEFSKPKAGVKAERRQALEDFLGAAARTESQVEENRGDGFGVAKPAAAHHSFQLADGKRFGLDLLVRVVREAAVERPKLIGLLSSMNRIWPG